MNNRFKAAALLLASSFSSVSMNVIAAQSAEFTPAQQARIGEIASDYLVAHPEVLIEVSKKLQVRQATMTARALTLAALHQHRLLMQLDGVPVKGAADSKVIVTEFFDYECIACSMMAPAMEQVIANNPAVRFAFRDWTIFAGRYPESTQASHRGLDIWRQKGADAYMAYHNGIYRTGHNEGKLTAGDIEKVATETGSGPENVNKRTQSDSLIEGNDTLADLLGLTGTPGIIVMPAENATVENTTVIPGVVTAAVMQQAIDKAKQ
ncbi:thioredoxin domain-containing protein [Acerihabitans sp. TG2]|uniref:DsbA family protein n=1 Tax=Acerihabitans sp. TG2 TaxID=3096008 RepID=UPI002B223237|nr:thioredoxin domain-containing protein [Acerihabitans sp. TG2]MEA9392711.1 thioredoxin domain-containing protein [Acerihabitans sp. TG2]